MMFKTHLLFGLLVGLFAVSWFNTGNVLLFMIFVMLGSAFADVDHPNSKFGKNVAVIGILFKHRGFFHSFFAVTLFTLLVHALFERTIVTLAFALGYASHIVIDMFNHQGVMPFHPLSNYSIKGFMKTDGVMEWFLMVILAMLVLVKLF